MNELLFILQQEIDTFLITGKRFFVNEKDLQIQLAQYLAKSHKKVHLEYHVPITEGHICKSGISYPWKEKTVYADLVVEENNMYVPIELKYKTCSKIKRTEVLRFGEQIEAGEIIKNQGAQDIGRYSFWKDVKRLELLNERFKNIAGGIAVFVTNDITYTYLPKSNEAPLVGYYDFRMFAPSKEDNVISGVLTWREKGDPIETGGDLCRFELSHKYTIPKWQHYNSDPNKDFGENEMHYMILLVKKQ